jgi:flavin reductase (DIM6/NTAB) family NADH-FMN oxidoreductase RutF
MGSVRRLLGGRKGATQNFQAEVFTFHRGLMSDYFYEPRKGHGLPHDPFKAIVAPRPIGWISTIDKEGRVNLAPYSFFNAFAAEPPIIGFSSVGRRSDSLNNAESTGEFVANLVSADLAHAMNLTAAPVAPGTDEMKLAHLSAAPSTRVSPPRVADAIASLESKVIRIIQLTDADGEKIKTWLVLGEVVGVHINDAYLKNGIFDTAAARPIARCGYRGDYAEVNSLFEMIRPAG